MWTVRQSVAVLLVTVGITSTALGQERGDVWRTFAQRLGAGTEVTVRLQKGPRFHATLVDVREDALVLQPHTRRPVPIQAVSYDALLTLERHERGGMGAAKAAAIGVASGVGAFLATLFIVMATVD